MQNNTWSRNIKERITVLLKPIAILCHCAWVLAVSAADPVEVAPGVFQVGTITNSEISESSGLVASKRFRGTYWTHNDSGHKPKLFAINREGESLAEFPVVGASIKDWEDIDVDGGGNLYIADIGNNAKDRDHLAVYRVREPNPNRPGTPVTIRKSWKLKFPGDAFDSEAFFVWHNFGYLISKEENGASLYRFRLSSQDEETVVLEKVGEFDLRAPVTGADLSRDGRRLALITGTGAYVFYAPHSVLTTDQPSMFFTPFENEKMEGGGFAGDGFLVSAESRELYLFNEIPFRAR